MKPPVVIGRGQTSSVGQRQYAIAYDSGDVAICLEYGAAMVVSRGFVIAGPKTIAKGKAGSLLIWVTDDKVVSARVGGDDGLLSNIWYGLDEHGEIARASADIVATLAGDLPVEVGHVHVLSGM